VGGWIIHIFEPFSKYHFMCTFKTLMDEKTLLQIPHKCLIFKVPISIIWYVSISWFKHEEGCWSMIWFVTTKCVTKCEFSRPQIKFVNSWTLMSFLICKRRIIINIVYWFMIKQMMRMRWRKILHHNVMNDGKSGEGFESKETNITVN